MIEADHRFRRYAMRLAEIPRDYGDHPFGALLVGSRGKILIEAENATSAKNSSSVIVRSNFSNIAPRCSLEERTM